MFTLFFLLVLAGILSFLTIATKGNIILAIVAAGAWIGNIAYVVLVPPSGVIQMYTDGTNAIQYYLMGYWK